MKNILKVLAAVLVVALPFVVASCSSDDDNKNEPKVRTYYWEVGGINLNEIPEDQQVEVINARNEVSKSVAKAYSNAGFNVNETQKSFTITCKDDELTSYNEKVEITFLTLKQTEDFKDKANILPQTAYLLVTLERKDYIVNKLLR